MNYLEKQRLFVVILFLLITVLTLFAISYYLSSRITQRYMPLIFSVQQLKIESVTAHQMFHQYVNEKQFDSIPRVCFQLDSTNRHTIDIVNSFDISVLKRTELEKNMNDFKLDIFQWKETLKSLHMTYMAGDSFTIILENYDKIFQNNMAKAQMVHQSLNKIIDREQRKYTFTNLVLIISIVSAVVLVIILFTYYNRTLKKNIKQLKENNDSLNDEICKRTAIEEHLRHTNRELEQYANAASHDLRTPVNAIANLTDWLEEELIETSCTLTDTAKEYLALLKDRTHRMSNFISSLLKYHSVKDIDRSVRAVNLQQIIESIIQNHPKHENAQTQYTIPETVELPREIVETLLTVTLNNSFDHNTNNSLNISIEYHEEEKFHRFKISDNGVGIPIEYHKKVFNPFYTIERKDEHSFSGMGLTIGKKVVDIVGGSIELHNETSGGLTVVVSIPKEISSNTTLFDPQQCSEK